MSNIDIKKLSIVTLVALSVISCSGKKEEDMTSKSSDEALGEGSGMTADESMAKDLDPRFGKNTPDRVFFEYDSADLSSQAKAAIEAQSEYIKNSGSMVKVEGHCDERGTREYNMALGNRRAGSVKAKLVRDGINHASIKTVSYGKDKPEVLGDNESAYSQNRRAVLIVEGK